MPPGTWLIVAAFFVTCLQGVDAEWTFRLTLVNYTAPDRSTGGHSCDGHGAVHHGKGECDPIFRLCRGPTHNLTCSDSAVFNDTHSIDFGPDGTTLFPAQFVHDVSAGYAMNVTVLDFDGNTTHQELLSGHHSFNQHAMVPGYAHDFVVSKHNYSLTMRLEIQCTLPFVGRHCNTTDHCASYPCQNGGQCQANSSSGGFHCQCQFDYTGHRCQISHVDHCDPNPCANGATCHYIIGDSYCSCVPGFKGEKCEQSAMDCASSPCQNNGTCHDAAQGNILGFGYTCTCPPDFTGAHCQHTSTEEGPMVG